MLIVTALVMLAAGEVCEGEPLPVPTRAEVIAFDLDAYAAPADKRGDCEPFSLERSKRCKETRNPVVIKGKPLQELTAVLRSTRSYDASRAMKCHDPRHRVRFYYGSSLLETYDVCFACSNVSLSGSNPFAGCEPAGSTKPELLTFGADAEERIRKVLASAKVSLVPKAGAAKD